MLFFKNLSAMALFSICSIFMMLHCTLELKDIIMDYIHKYLLKKSLLIFVKLFFNFLVLVTIYNLVRLIN